MKPMKSTKSAKTMKHLVNEAERLKAIPNANRRNPMPTQIARPSGKKTADQMRHALNVSHASGRLQPNARARQARGQWRGNRSTSRGRAIAEQVRS